MWDLEQLIRSTEENQAEIDGRWVPARPMQPFGFWGFLMRVKDSLKVFTGKAEAFTWPGNQ